jgi:hypothetical protein
MGLAFHFAGHSSIKQQRMRDTTARISQTEKDIRPAEKATV